MTLEEIRDRIAASIPEAVVDIVENPSPSGQHALRVDGSHLFEVATLLREDPELSLDYCSNVTGVDWLDREEVETVKKTVPAEDGSGEKVITEKVKRQVAGYLEVVYHLYSMRLKEGPVVIRVRTGNRSDDVRLPSLTPVWRSCEFQEREIYDLFGIVFDGHPDLRRILMWDEFCDHPMRKDYVEPDDYEWEPTPHDTVLAKAKAHYPASTSDAENTEAES